MSGERPRYQKPDITHSDQPSDTEGMEFYPIVLESIEVVPWRPQSDGQGSPTELHVLLTVEGADLPLVMRFKGPATLDAFISALASHRFSIWPEQDFTEEEFNDRR